MNVSKFLFLILTLLLSLELHAANTWVSSVPKEVRLLGDGLLVVGDFLMSDGVTKQLSTVSCAGSKNLIFLPSSDPQFDRKLSMALAAQASGKTLVAYIYDTGTSNVCTTLSAHGSVATVYHYYWYIK
tara:strand:- start:7743 stop:8126 length:384 start_codon:yes stop_codon:yes gene_type:complete